MGASPTRTELTATSVAHYMWWLRKIHYLLSTVTPGLRPCYNLCTPTNNVSHINHWNIFDLEILRYRMCESRRSKVDGHVPNLDLRFQISRCRKQAALIMRPVVQGRIIIITDSWSDNPRDWWGDWPGDHTIDLVIHGIVYWLVVRSMTTSSTTSKLMVQPVVIAWWFHIKENWLWVHCTGNIIMELTPE